MMDQNVQNLIIGVLSCLGYEKLKAGASITSAMVKDKLRTWLDIDEKAGETIANTINNTPDAYMANEEIFNAFIKTNPDILQFLSNPKGTNTNTISGGTFTDSTVNQGGTIEKQTINYGHVPETQKKA